MIEKETPIATLSTRSHGIKNDYLLSTNSNHNPLIDYSFVNPKTSNGTDHTKSTKKKVIKDDAELHIGANSITINNHEKSDNLLDIRTLREKSKNLDLPLISALCNDRSLLQQTNAFVMPKHPANNRTSSNTSGNNGGSTSETIATESSNKHHYTSSSSANKMKYPVSGLSTTQITKPTRNKMPPVQHQHPISKSMITTSQNSNSRINIQGIVNQNSPRSTNASTNTSSVVTTLSGMTTVTASVATSKESKIH